MARDRANINTTIWTDDDWRDLTRDEHWLYTVLLTSPALSYAGVTDWRPARIAQNSSGTTPADVERIGALLEAKRFIFVDTVTEEVLVRSFLRHDGLLKQPKLGVSMVNAYGALSSKPIRRIVIHELRRLHDEHPEWRAFEVEQVKNLLKLSGSDMSAFPPGLTPSFTPNPEQAQTLPTSTATTTTTTKEKPSSSQVADATPRPEVDALLDLLDEQIALNGLKAPSRTKTNHDAARLLLDRDGYDLNLVRAVLLWATGDEFWRKNVLSMSKFRSQFTQLLAKSGLAQGGSLAATGGGQEINVDAILGKDYWTVPEAPQELGIREGIEWKKARRAEHDAQRLEEAKRKVMDRAV